MNQLRSTGECPRAENTQFALTCMWVLIGAVLFMSTGYRLRADEIPRYQSGDRVRIEPRVRYSSSARAEPGTAEFRTDTSLVLVNVTVVDSRNRLATGLTKDSFRLFENRAEQALSFVSSEDVPLSVGVVFDTSGSMASRLGRSKQSVGSFLNTANPQDEFFLVQFNDRAELSVPFTSAVESIQNRVAFTKAKGATALFDAVYLALNQMKQARNSRRALLLVSDGGDNWSRYSESELKALIRETDVQIYSIGIVERPFARSRRSPQRRQGSAIMTYIAEESGGRYFSLSNLKDLPGIARTIGNELRNQYVLGFISNSREKDGKYRRLQVKLNQTRGSPRLKAYHRLGYYAPTK